MYFDHLTFSAMEKRQKARFINSLAGFKSANLIGTRDAKGQENVAVVSSLIHLGSNPALLGFISRPHSVERHSLENIVTSGFFTANAVTEQLYRAAHQTSARYQKHESEFEQTGLTPVYSDLINAPYVKESPLKIGLKLVETLPIAANDTVMIIGEVQEVWVDSEAVMKDGYIDLEKLSISTISGLDSYHRTERLDRLSYAKPNQPLTRIDVNGEPLE